MTTLALDCSTTGLSLALQNGTQTFTFTTPTPRSSDIMAAEIANLFQQSNTTAAQLEHILVTTGPGSFTGIRLGLAVAEAFRLTNPALTVTGLSTLHALAWEYIRQTTPTNAFTLVLDAAGGQTYTQSFTPTGTPLDEAACLPLTNLPTTHPLVAPTSLMLNAQPLPALNATTLLELAQNTATHLPPHPVYLKPLTYKMTQQA